MSQGEWDVSCAPITMQKTLVLNGIRHLPHYQKPGVFVGPGRPAPEFGQHALVDGGGGRGELPAVGTGVRIVTFEDWWETLSYREKCNLPADYMRDAFEAGQVAEREACVKAVEGIQAKTTKWGPMAGYCADAIRARRGDKP